MKSASHTISAMTDMSANIFSLLILVLIIVLAARANSTGPSAKFPSEVDIKKNLASIERSPLGSDGLFDLLYERNETMRSIKIDLLGNSINIVSNGKTEHFNSVENAALRLRVLAQTSNRAAIGVYVFSNRFYRGISDALQALKWQWREVSVPQALTDVNAANNGQGWSPGFSKLIAGPIHREQFRTELARLLESSTSRERLGERGGGGNAFGSASVEASPDTIVNALLRWLGAALKIAALTAGFAFVLWVELRYKRMRGPAMRA